MKKIYYLIYGILCLWITTTAVLAQQRPVHSQYMFNPLLINPAYAGHQKQLSATMHIRNQWVNLEGAPKTQTLSAHTNIDRKNIGVGLTVYNEQIGVHNDFGIFGSYAYQIKFAKSALSLGIQGGLNRLSSDFFKLTLKSYNDPLIDQYNQFNPNFGTGVFYRNETGYIGASVPYLINNRRIERDEIGKMKEAREKRYYFVHAGKVFPINKDVQVKPSMLLRIQEGAPIGADLNLNFFLQKIINAGVSYRTGDSFIMMFELTLNENFSFGYSYDLISSSLNTHTRGSHEIMLNYRIRLTSTACHSNF